MQITRLEITGLRAIRELALNFETENKEPCRRRVLLGANGAGKTTILEAIAHVFQELGPAELGALRLSPGDVGIPPEGLDPGGVGATDAARRAQIQLHASLADEERETLRTFFPSVSVRGAISVSVPARTILTSQYGGDAPFDQTARGLLRDLKFAPAVLLTADRGSLEQRDVSIADVVRFDPREGCLAPGRDRFAPLAARLALATAATRFDPGGAVARMWKVLRKYFPELPRPVEHGTDLNLWFVTRGGSTVPLSKLSDGERAVLLIFGELALRNPRLGIVLIDEIEQHLHPRWQRAILEALTSLLPFAQFVVTTQSPYLAAVAPDDVIKIGDWDAYGA
jgi:energy-coupling factor transporter ATP-binding protein EcfA2